MVSAGCITLLLFSLRQNQFHLSPIFGPKILTFFSKTITMRHLVLIVANNGYFFVRFSEPKFYFQSTIYGLRTTTDINYLESDFRTQNFSFTLPFLIVADDAYFFSPIFLPKILTFFSDKDNFQSTLNCGRRCKLLSPIFRAILIPISIHVKCPFCQRITLVGIRFWGQNIMFDLAYS